MKTITISACLLLFMAACSNDNNSASIVPVDGVIRLSEQFTGDFALVDKTGAARADEDFEGKVMLVYFGFTHCPDVCPGDVGVMSAALNELGDDADNVAPLFISVDPERDSPEALDDYFAFDERIIPLTGSVEAAEAARVSFKQYARRVELPDSALIYTMDHARFFYIADRTGQPTHALTGGASPVELAAILRQAIAAS